MKTSSNILNKLYEGENVGGMTIYDYIVNVCDGEIDMDVSDTEIDMMVALCYDVNDEYGDEYPEMRKFLTTLVKNTKIVKQIDGGYAPILICDFSSFFKPYNEQLKDFFDMDYSDFDADEAYYEAVANLEPLISGNASEGQYKELNDILEGKVSNNSSGNGEDKEEVSDASMNESTNFDLPEGYEQEVYDAYFAYCNDIDLTNDEPLDFNDWYNKIYKMNESVETEAGNDFDEIASYMYKDAGNDISNIPTIEDMDYIADVTDEEYQQLYKAVETAIGNVADHFYNGMIELSDRPTINYLNGVENDEDLDEAEQVFGELRDEAFKKFEEETKVGIWQDGRMGRHIVVEDDYYNARDYAKLCEIQEKYEQWVIDEFNKHFAKDMNEAEEPKFLGAIRKIEYIKDLIKESPELFHDGINEDIVSLLNDLQDYLNKTNLNEDVTSTNLDRSKIANFIKDSVEKLQTTDFTNCKYNLDDRFALYVGWSDGYDAEETNEYEIHNPKNPTSCINAVIGIRNDADFSDLDYINRPYYESGDVFEAEWIVSPSENYLYLTDSIIKMYNDMLELLDTGELLTESSSIFDNSEDHSRDEDNIYRINNLKPLYTYNVAKDLTINVYKTYIGDYPLKAFVAASTDKFGKWVPIYILPDKDGYFFDYKGYTVPCPDIFNKVDGQKRNRKDEYYLEESVEKDLNKIADELVKTCWNEGKTHDVHTEVVGLLDNIKYDTGEFPELDFVREYNLTDEDYDKLYSLLCDRVNNLIKEDVAIDNDPDLDNEQVEADVDYWTEIDEANTEDVSDKEPLGVYTVSNNNSILIYEIEYDIHDRVLAGDSSNRDTAMWKDIIYDADETYFWYGDIKVPLDEVMRTNI